MGVAPRLAWGNARRGGHLSRDVTLNDTRPLPLRADRRTIDKLLERLDQDAVDAPGIDRRSSERFGYRVADLTIELPRGETTAHHCTVPRNLSGGGVGLLVGQFVYPDTACRVLLRGSHGFEQVVRGWIARCRYLVGSGSVYEAGVEFERPIDVELFAEGAQHVSLLLVNESPKMQHLIASLIDELNVDLTCALGGDDAIETTLEADFDLILIDLDSEVYDPFALTSSLRSNGYLGPIVGLAVQSGADLQLRCAEVGCTGYLTKPLTRRALEELFASLRHEPLISSLANDDRLAPLINEFVAALPDKAREMAAAYEADDLDTVHRVARSLRADAGSYGFERITEDAGHVQALAGMGAARERLRPALYDLIHLCLLARPARIEADIMATPRRRGGHHTA